MLSIKEILSVKPSSILAVNYDGGSIGEMIGEDRDLNLYLADITIQYHSLTDNACLSFTVECLVRTNDNKVTIEVMNTNSDYQTVFSQNIDGLIDGHVTIGEYGCIDIDYHDMLQELIDNQPIYEIPNHFIIEAF